jgi:hypothetical protein
MDRQQLSSICEQIYHKFPEVNGKQPKVQSQPGDQTLLIFTGSAMAADGRKITRTVRVVANQSGKIIKVSTSR